MRNKKKEKLKMWLIILMLLLLITALILFFLGHYGKAIILLGIFITIITSLSNWLQMKNEVYIHEKSYKNNKW